jgi:HAMP domain-containing protein
MGWNAGDERFLVTRLTNGALLGGLAAAAVALLLGLYLANRLSRPVQALTLAAHQLSLGDLSQRVKVTGRMSWLTWGMLLIIWPIHCRMLKKAGVP